METDNFQDITVKIDKITSDPNHHEKLLYSFTLSPPPTDKWREVFLEPVWSLRQQFSPSMDASFLGADTLVIRCYELCVEKDINDDAADATASTNRHYRELIRETDARRARDESERERGDTERERLIKEKTGRLKANS